jgi:LPS sulfotransferase NodH
MASQLVLMVANSIVRGTLRSHATGNGGLAFWMPEMRETTEALFELDQKLPDVYPATSIHSIEIEKSLPIWDECGSAHFKTMTNKKIRIVFVCFVNRSGSNYLLDLMQQLELGAYPTDEALNSEEVIARCRNYNVSSFASYLAKIVLASAQNGFRVLKIGGEQLFWLTKRGFISQLIASGVCPKFVLISRADKVAQAVSLFIAEATGRFSEFKMGSAESASESETVEYDGARILDRLRYVLYQEHLFSLFFLLHGLNCRRVLYEDLVAKPQVTLRGILRYLGAPEVSMERLALIEAGGKIIVRQGGDLNRAFIDRFRSDFRIAGC